LTAIALIISAPQLQGPAPSANSLANVSMRPVPPVARN
jgi:hypothetical protein